MRDIATKITKSDTLDAETLRILQSIEDSMLPEHSSKPIDQSTVLVAMSGGVDSSVSAAALSYIGYKVLGVTLRLSNSTSGGCCGVRDVNDAREVSGRSGFRHYVLDYSSIFKQEVVDKFIGYYKDGKTPSPCIDCNKTVKFRDLYKLANDIGADYLVTGHYAKMVCVDNNIRLGAAIDQARDQSYFLYFISNNAAQKIRFPLGNLPKSDVRFLAKSLDLAVHNKKDSQDICFVKESTGKNGGYRLLIDESKGGNFITENGAIVGKHDGSHNFTVGQRKGLNISNSNALYVKSIDAQTGDILLTERNGIEICGVELVDFVWHGNSLNDNDSLPIKFKLRSTQAYMNGVLKFQNNSPVVHFSSAIMATGLGQICALYDSNGVVLGGGEVCKNIFVE